MKKYSGRLILRNDFHNTEVVVIAKEGILSESSLNRARKKLCGIKECLCGDIRGRQDKIIDFYENYAKVWEPEDEYERLIYT